MKSYEELAKETEELKEKIKKKDRTILGLRTTNAHLKETKAKMNGCYGWREK